MEFERILSKGLGAKIRAFFHYFCFVRKILPLGLSLGYD